MDENILHWLWLTLNLSNRDITALLEHFDSAAEIYNAKDYPDISGIKPSSKRALMNKSLKPAEKMRDKAIKYNTKILTFDDVDFPDSLRMIESPPYVLYVRGEIMKWDRLLCVGVVGTRKATEYGIQATEKIAGELAENGITIVSGMAEGIDSASARAALDAGGKTIAVLGCGIDIVYPKENSPLMREIMENGTVITEYPFGTPARPGNFPWRNRIISGLSRGILVTEAPRKSGALITANYALEQGKDIFAVPGSIFKEKCEGTNMLLSRCAKAVWDADGILEEYVYEIERLKIEKPNGLKKIFNPNKESVNNEIRISITDKRFSALTEDEKTIIELLIGSNMHIDTIKRESGFDVAKLTPILSMLEFSGHIQKIPGNNYKINL